MPSFGMPVEPALPGGTASILQRAPGSRRNKCTRRTYTLGTGAQPTSAMPRRSAQGHVILIVQRSWFIASGLATAFETRGAKVVIAKNLHPDLANIPNLSAAVLDSPSHELCRELEAKAIPFVLYTAQSQLEAASVIEKPASPKEVVARVEELLT